MGCDIHIWAEVRKQEGDKWKKVGKVFPYHYFNAKEPVSAHNQQFTDEAYTGRNYHTFSILANVRNGTELRDCNFEG